MMDGVDIYDMACDKEQGLETGIAERIGDGLGGGGSHSGHIFWGWGVFGLGGSENGGR